MKSSQEPIQLTRREFLIRSTLFVLGCYLAACKPQDSTESEDYYTANRDRFLKAFQSDLAKIGPTLEKNGYANLAGIILDQSPKEFERLLGISPNLGGASNFLMDSYIQPLGALAIHFTLKRQGLPVEKIGAIYYDWKKSIIEEKTNFLSKFSGDLQFSFIGQNSIKKGAEWSQERLYPENFVFKYVEGQKDFFDYGIDVTECAVVKFFQAQGASELTPYICPIDHVLSKSRGTGLKRTTTIAWGGKLCDFRYKNGGTEQEGWPPPVVEN